jgi:DUF4097 and DUF4098 domain-containing protein YvlB
MGRKVFIINCVLAIAFIAGCDWIPIAKYTKQVNLTVPAGQAELFTAKTHNGKITIKGSETTDCNLTATIIVRAYTEENAKKIAEQVKIDLVSEGNSINVKIEKPEDSIFTQISVNLEANLPQIMNLSLKTHNGSIHCSSITGWLRAESHNGNIIVADASGDTDLSTHNGNIDYKGISADLKFNTNNGNIDIQCKGQSAKPCEITAKTNNGNIDFAAPEKFSASVDASTHNGSVRTDLPLTLTGKNNKKTIKGVIGDDRDKLHLKTHNGSIKIK